MCLPGRVIRHAWSKASIKTGCAEREPQKLKELEAQEEPEAREGPSGVCHHLGETGWVLAREREQTVHQNLGQTQVATVFLVASFAPSGDALCSK